MGSTQQSDTETYRAIVLGQGGNELLLRQTGDGFLLPSVEIPRSRRIAENLTVAMRTEWGCEAVCLFNLDASAPVFSTNDHNYEVMEACGPVAKSSHRTAWVRIASLSQIAFADPADYMAVQRSFADCAKYSDGVAQGPFGKLGWFTELRTWIENIIRPADLYLTGVFSQLNARSSFSLLRFETNGPAVWFKAVGKPNLQEFPITIALARFLPRYTPPILATRTAWHGWLTLEVDGTNLGETREPQHWKTVASALANLQIESTDNIGVLIDSGARDLRASALLKLVHPFLDALGQLMEKQTKVPPRILSRGELMLLAEQIEEALSFSADLGIPDALGHLDLNPGNVIVSGNHSVFLDWAEAYVGNPLFSFQYFVEHFRRMAGPDATAESSLTSAYAEAWHSLVSPENLADAMAFAPVLAVFVYAVATDAWADQSSLQDPKVAGHLRSLTRRMHREANRLKKRTETLCDFSF